MQTYNPSATYGASSTKARLRKFMQTYNPSVTYGASSPYTGEPIEVRADLIFSGTDQSLPCVKGGGPPVAVEGL